MKKLNTCINKKFIKNLNIFDFTHYIQQRSFVKMSKIREFRISISRLEFSFKILRDTSTFIDSKL